MRMPVFVCTMPPVITSVEPADVPLDGEELSVISVGLVYLSFINAQ